jgi:serine/threonine protein phosphatase PrpC
VQVHKLDPNDEYLILASDGLWDEFSRKKAAKIATEELIGKDSREHKHLAD